MSSSFNNTVLHVLSYSLHGQRIIMKLASLIKINNIQNQANFCL